MNLRDIAKLRLISQQIACPTAKEPSQTLASMGSIQAQDYQAALWAIGLRTQNTTQKDVEATIANRKIIRLWLMRGTLHFVAASDVRWMLELLAPRVIEGRAGRHRQLSLDDATFARAKKLLNETLQSGPLTRDQMFRALERGGVSIEGQRGYHILWRTTLEGLICFGAQRGKEQTFVLLDQYVPKSSTMPRKEALGELAYRYFSSRGPALIEDFVWWSELKLSDAKAALETAAPRLASKIVGGKTYWMPQDFPETGEEQAAAFLLPAFDEYILGYRDRSAALDQPDFKKAVSSNGIFYPTIILDGKVAGTWKRINEKGKTVIAIKPFKDLSPKQKHAVNLAGDQYGRFLEKPVSISQ